MTDVKYWVWYSLVVGAAARNDDILSTYPDPKKLYEATDEEKTASGIWNNVRRRRAEKNLMQKAENIVRICEKNSWKIVTPDSRDYPDALRRLIDMPVVLYVEGDTSCLNSDVAIGVVGTRNPGGESVDVAKKISAQLSAAGALVVSGGALGIDSAAHEGAILGKGKTVCVLGCGLGTGYLRENEALRHNVSKNGAVVTEYPPFSLASRYTFPARNRIISGMSKGVLVVEAGEHSGSLITAKRATEQGREVYAIPGSIISTAYMGANKLIRDGAKAVSNAADILTPYKVMYPDVINLKKIDELPEELRIISSARKPDENKEKLPKEKRPLSASVPPEAAAVYEFFGDSPLHPDEISAMSGMPLSAVVSALIKLELEDYIVQTDGKNYELK